MVRENERLERGVVNLLNGPCAAKPVDGNPCRFKANGSGFCPLHDPSPDARERRRIAARTAGQTSGRTRRERRERATALGPVSLKTPEDAKSLVEKVVNQVLAGQMDLARARLLVKASGVLLGYSRTEDETRLEALEQLVEAYDLNNVAGWETVTEMYRERGARIVR